MDTIIAYRVNGGKVNLVMTEDGSDICVFPHHDDAVAYADEVGLFQSGQADYQIITLDEL
jgi:hypothetical protein